MRRSSPSTTATCRARRSRSATRTASRRSPRTAARSRGRSGRASPLTHELADRGAACGAAFQGTRALPACPSEMTGRTAGGWLDENSAALAALSFDVDAESPILAEDRRHARSPMTMSHQAYGPLVAVPRILDLLAGYGLPATFFVPGLTADRYPETVERIVAAGHEVGHHGDSHHSPLRLDEDAERADLERGLEALDRLRVRPPGYRTPSWEPSERPFGPPAHH